MKKIGNLSAKKTEIKSDMQFISKRLTNRQKEIIRLLQNKEILMVDERGILVTCGKETKKITPHPFYNIVNRGLVFRQTEWPYSYILSVTGAAIKV